MIPFDRVNCHVMCLQKEREPSDKKRDWQDKLIKTLVDILTWT